MLLSGAWQNRRACASDPDRCGKGGQPSRLRSAEHQTLAGLHSATRPGQRSARADRARHVARRQAVPLARGRPPSTPLALAERVPRRSASSLVWEALPRVSDGIRTRDRRDHNPELYQLSYAHQGHAI
jgi:hypothetical protein